MADEKVISSWDSGANDTNNDTVESLARSVQDLTVQLMEVSKIVDENNSFNSYISKSYALQRTGKVFTTKFPRYDISTSSTGMKMDDNENMVCTPSSPSTKNRNDYESEPMFKPIECNWELDDETGKIIITALQDSTDPDNKFARDGSNGQVGILNMPWYAKTWEDDYYWYISVSDTGYDGYTLLQECLDPSGNNQGFMVHSKYAMVDIDGKPYSASGRKPLAGENATLNTTVKPNFNNLVAYCRKHNNYYCAETSADLFFIQLQIMIKYATINSQSVLGGCTDYYLTYQCRKSTENENYAILTTSNANNLVVGSRVSIGTSSSGDRGAATGHDVVYSAKILSINAIEGTSNSKVILDTESFSTDATMFMITMPWWTGACDNVLGIDGSAGESATSRKYPVLIGGIECFLGGYEVLGNVIMDIQTVEDTTVQRDIYICHDATKISTNVTTMKANSKKSEFVITGNTNSWRYISKHGIDLENGIMVPTEYEATSSTGFADGLYVDSGTSGQREWLGFGHLNGGSAAGAWILSAYYSLGNSYWAFLSRLSPNGMCNSINA
jgi:hypothetical protein